MRSASTKWATACGHSKYPLDVRAQFDSGVSGTTIWQPRMWCARPSSGRNVACESAECSILPIAVPLENAGCIES